MKKKLFLLLFIIPIMLAQTIGFTAFTRSKDSSPWTDTYLDSVLVIRYEDDRVTFIESLYTDVNGYVSSDTATLNTTSQSIYVTKSGYSFLDNGWVAFTTSGLTTGTTKVAVSMRGLPSTSDSTVTISFYLIDIDGTPLTSQRITHYASAPYRGTNSSLTIPSRSDSPYRSKTYTSTATGLIEITTLKNSTNFIRVGDINLTIPFVATVNMDLDSLRFYP